MSSSVLSAPSPFKPSLVSEYFFGEDASPVADPNAQTQGWSAGGQQTSPSPDTEGDTEASPEGEGEASGGGGGGGRSGRGSGGSEDPGSSGPDGDGTQQGASAMEVDLEEQRYPPDAAMRPQDSQQLVPPSFPKPDELMPHYFDTPVQPSATKPESGDALPDLILNSSQFEMPRAGVGGGAGLSSAAPSSTSTTPSAAIVFFPSQPHSYSTSTSSTAGSSASASYVSSPVGASGHSMKVHQRLIDAAMADETQMGGVSAAQHKHSAFSTPSSVTSSHVGASQNYSPVSPMSDTHMSNSTHTPSPPLLTLPNTAAAEQARAAGATHRQSATIGTEIPTAISQSHQQQAQVRPQPASSPTRYRTVPAAATCIPPLQVPTHAAGAPRNQPYHATEHAQTPKATPTQQTRPRNSNRGAVVTQSTPGTPQPSSQRAIDPQHTVRKLALVDDPNAEYVGPFVLGPVLGRGCTGTVRLGTHRLTNFQVAFKIIEKKYLIGEQEGGSGAPQPGAPVSEMEQSKLWKKVKREIAILKLIEHPHVLKLYDVLETENRLYLVLEHVSNGELFDYIVSKGRLDRHEALRIAAQIVMGLEHCHAHNICHRDLKPENLLITSDKNIKIADFGMAQLMKKDGILKTSCGSPHYASPEIIEGHTYDAKCTDVWSIGVILYALITGSLPFDHDNIPTLLTMVTRGRYTTPQYVPPDIAHLISRMLTVDPTKRITIPEIKKHIAFKSYNYFPTHESSTDALMRRIAVPRNHHSLPPHTKSHKKSRITAEGGGAAAAACDADDSDEGEAHDSVGHEWRHRSGGEYEPAKPDPLLRTNSSPAAALRPSRGSLQSLSSSSSRLSNDDELDDAVLNDLESLGLGSKEVNREKIRAHDGSKEPSLEVKFYMMLRQRKADRLKELATLSPKMSPTRPRLARKHAQSSHHRSSGARKIMDSRTPHVSSQPSSGGLEPLPLSLGSAACSSQPASQLSSPTDAARHAASRGLMELSLPPPATRPPTEAGSSRTSPSQDASSMLDVSTAASSAQRGTSIMSHTASPGERSGNALLHSSIFAPPSTLASSVLGLAASSTVTPAAATKSDALRVAVPTHTPAAEASQAHTPGKVTMSPSTSTVSAGTPAAVGAACAVTGALAVASMSATPTPSPPTASPMPVPMAVLNIPPMQHCYSDGSVPESIMDTSAAAYYQSRVAPLVVPPIMHASESASGTAPVTPTQHPASASFTFSAFDSELKPSPPHYSGSMLSPPLMQLPSMASSAHASPEAQACDSIYERRMSTPQYESRSGQGATVPAAARELFPASSPVDTHAQQQAALDQYSRTLPPDAAGPVSQRMELDFVAQSAPMNPQPHVHFASPPPLALPPRLMHVGESSGSESERADTAEEGAVHASAGRQVHARPRAYSQDETNLLLVPRHPSDTVMSNIHTPLGTAPGQLPSYSTSPRFHRPYFHAPPENARREMGMGGAAVSSRAPAASGHAQQAPPSPQHKRSWFSSGFMGSIFKLVGGKRSSAHMPAAAAAHVQSSPSPLLSSIGNAGSSRSSARLETKLATLTVSNELIKIFRDAGVQFTIQKGYRIDASYQPAAMEQGLDNFATPPMPPAMPPMQRAVSTPSEPQAQRPRSSSNAAESTPHNGSPTDAHTAIPSTPKPTPTHALQHPFVPQSVPQYPDPSPSDDDSTYESSADPSMIDVSSSLAPARSSGSVTPMQSPPPLSASRPAAARPRSSVPLFGPLGCRFVVEILEAAHDTRVITCTRKTGDEETFHKIVDYIRPQLHG